LELALAPELVEDAAELAAPGDVEVCAPREVVVPEGVEAPALLLPPLPLDGCVVLADASTTTVPFMNGWIVQK
jgi:hypothetical protein